MQLNIERKPIQGIDGTEKIHQTIKQKDMGHIAYILSAKLYSDAPLAVVREYTCNATDAHNEVGKGDTPVEIHAPSDLEPFFSVRDFGNGITFDQMKDMYIHLGDSSKRNSNEGIGCFGIGNMAFRSYTDGMTVTSWCDGEKATYSLQVGEDNKVFAIVLGKTKMKEGEKTGVQIEVAIKPHDVSIFRKKIAYFAKYMKVTPKTSVDIVKDEIDLGAEDNSWYFPKSERKGWNRPQIDPVIVMGGVPYEIKKDFEGFSDSMKTALRDGIVIDVPLGSVGITPDREKLDYNPTTVRFIKKRLTEIIKEITDKAQKDLEGEKDYFEFVLKAKKLGYLKCISLGDLEFKGKKLEMSLKPLYKKKSATILDQYEIAFTGSLTHASKDWNGTDKVRSNRGDRVSIDESVVVLKNDTGSNNGINQRIATIFKTLKHTNIYVVDPTHDNFAEWSKEYHLDTWSKSRVLNASDFEKARVSIANGTRVTREKVKVFKLIDESPKNRSYYASRGGESAVWKDSESNEIVDGDTKYYFPISRYKIVKNNDYHLSIRNMSDKDRKGLFQMFPQIFGVREKDAKKLDDSWVNIMEELETNSEKYLFDDRVFYSKVRASEEALVKGWTINKDNQATIDSFPFMKEVIKTLVAKNKKSISNEHSNVISALEALGFCDKLDEFDKKVKDVISKSKIGKYAKFWEEKCPMLDLVFEKKFHLWGSKVLTVAERRDITLYMKAKEKQAKEIKV